MNLLNGVTIPYWNQDRENVFLDRYALKDDSGQPIEKHPTEMWERVSAAIAENEAEADAFYDLLGNFKFVPGGRILASAGSKTEAVSYNCFVIPIEPDSHKSSAGRDSREAIFDTIGRMVNIMSSGGGVGINWSTLRPRNAHLSRINGTSSGPCGWMDVASVAVGEVIQGGSRRGAAMFMLDDWHPDILEFCDVKRDRKKVQSANISVAISDDFMQAVKLDDVWELIFPDTSSEFYNSKWDGDMEAWRAQGQPVVIHKTIRARELWDKICAGAWDNGDPGVVFLERYNQMSTAGDIERIICVNPCGEQGLGAYSVCNLGSMNLHEYVDESGIFHRGEFSKDVRTAIRFLDNVIDKTHYMDSMPETEAAQKKIRRIGLGVMGLADALARMKVAYGSPESVKFVEKYSSVMKEEALWASAELAEEKGAAPGWDKMMIHKPFFDDIHVDLMVQIEDYGLRNLLLLTQAPTGTTSMLAGVSSGIEPYFALEYERKDRIGTRTVRPLEYTKYVDMLDPFVGDGKLPDYFTTANDVTVEQHVAVQAAAQAYIDSSISKTVNAPNSHTRADVAALYMLAYDSGLKGIAYFREGCNSDTVLSRPKTETEVDKPAILETASPYVRPTVVTGSTQRMNSKHGHVFVTVNYAEDNGPIEVFINVGRAGSELAEWSEGMGRLISLALVNKIPKDKIAEQLQGVGGYSQIVPSLSTAVATALEGASMGVVPTPEDIVYEDTTREAPRGLLTAMLCSKCGNFAVVREEGCNKCQICGDSVCG